MKKTTETAFIQNLQNGIPGVIDELYAAYYRPLCYFAEELVHHTALAEDLATDSFIKLLNHPGGFDSMGGMKSFLYTVTRHACYDHLRTEQRHATAHAEINHEGRQKTETAEQLYLRAELLQEIYRAIEALPAKYQGVVRLALLEGKKNEEIADQLNMATQTVRNHKSDGFKLLRLAFADRPYLASLLAAYWISQGF